MILILLSWGYLFFTALTFGIALSKIIRIKQFDVVITTILGLFHITILASIWAFFYPINIGFHVLLVLLSALFWFNNKTTFFLIIKNTFDYIKEFSLPIKIIFAVSSLLILAQSATLPFIIDNESYYIQTIKWLNEYGFVKGLANLHLFFGQASGWHVTQSVYSLSFLYDQFNDLNGFTLLLFNFFAFKKLQDYFTNGNKLDLVFGLLPITYLFLFQFISSPSPDLPIYIFAFLIFSIYLQTTNIVDRFTILSILCLYAVFIKITAVALLLFPIIVLIKNYKILKRQLVKIILVGSSIIVVFITKNTLLTGYALFPLLFLRIDSLDYTVPSSVMNFFFSKSMLYSFYVDNADFDTLSILDLIKHYFINNGLLGFIGIASVCTLFIIPFLLFKKRLVSSIWTIYFAFIILIFLLIFSSPQYRFYVYFTLFFSVVLLSFLISNPNQIIRLQTVSLSVVAFFLFVPISFSNLTSNILLNKNSTFKIKNTIVPEPNSKWNSEFRGGSVGNMKYNSPLDNSFFWVTGNGELPCVNTTQIDYFHKGFSFIPQQRSNDLNDGFYAQKVNNDE